MTEWTMRYIQYEAFSESPKVLLESGSHLGLCNDPMRNTYQMHSLTDVEGVGDQLRRLDTDARQTPLNLQDRQRQVNDGADRQNLFPPLAADNL